MYELIDTAMYFTASLHEFYDMVIQGIITL